MRDQLSLDLVHVVGLQILFRNVDLAMNELGVVRLLIWTHVISCTLVVHCCPMDS